MDSVGLSLLGGLGFLFSTLLSSATSPDLEGSRPEEAKTPDIMYSDWLALLARHSWALLDWWDASAGCADRSSARYGTDESNPNPAPSGKCVVIVSLVPSHRVLFGASSSSLALPGPDPRRLGQRLERSPESTIRRTRFDSSLSLPRPVVELSPSNPVWKPGACSVIIRGIVSYEYLCSASH